MQLQDFVQPEPNVRVIEVGKNKLYLKRKDPYGYVYINFERGELPLSLKGAFTSFDEAVKKVEIYLSTKPEVQEPAPVEEPVSVPVVKKVKTSDSA
jgi:hypothetical protein